MRLSTSIFAATLLAFFMGEARPAAQSAIPSCDQRKETRPAPMRPVKDVPSRTSIPEDWQKIDVRGKFSFYLPPDMKRSNVSGIESLFREYTNDKVRLYVEYEPYSILSYDSRMLDGKQGYEEVVSEIDGRRAMLFTYYKDEESRRTYNVELYVGDWANRRVELIMAAQAQNAANLEVAKRVFGTLHFYK